MKKPITYREITIAIGILVAMVVALTLWTRLPAKPLSVSPAGRHAGLPSAASHLLEITLDAFSRDAAAELTHP